MNSRWAVERKGLRIPIALRSLSYNRILRQVARQLKLQNTLRLAYYRLVLASNRMFSLQAAGLEARFLAQTPGELRLLDQSARKKGESRVLERLITLAGPGDCVYDIGAHVGLYTIFFAKAVGQSGQVIALEPSSESYRHLLENLALNQLENVHVYRCALGDRRGTESLYFGEENAEGSLTRPAGNKYAGSEPVQVVEGDWLAEENRLSLPRIVKIDVEGSEHAVLRGLAKTLAHPNCEILDCEIHPDLLPAGIDANDVLQVIRSCGFQKWDLYNCDSVVHALAQKV